MLANFIEWLLQTINAWGYPGIVFLMALESSVFPVPSELVMPPAGYLAQQGEMNAFIAIICGVVGSWLGALANYSVACYLGRPFLARWGKYILINEHKLLRVENFFRRHGEIGTFTGRLIPVVRHYISFPAGLAHMKMSHFLFFTGIGSGIWVTILVWIGYIAGQNQDLIKEYSRDATKFVVVACVVIISGYIYWQKRKARGAKDDQSAL